MKPIEIIDELRIRTLAAYIPCRGVLNTDGAKDFEYPAITNMPVTVYGYMADDLRVQNLDYDCDDWVSHKDVQLILNPVSTISNIDAKAIAGIIGMSNRDSMKYIGCNHDSLIAIGKYVASELSTGHFDFIIRPSVLIQAYDYLRSKGYDMGYGEIKSLIKAGIAITV